MAVSCPGCGQEVPVTEREVTLLSGACPGCARDVVLWSSTAGSAPTEETSEAAPALSVTHQDGDEDCEGTLSLVVGDKGRLVGTCSDCGSEFVFTLETGADARQRIVRLTARAESLLPTIEAEWAVTDAAVRELEAELPFPLSEILAAVLRAVERRSLRQRLDSLLPQRAFYLELPPQPFLLTDVVEEDRDPAALGRMRPNAVLVYPRCRASTTVSSMYARTAGKAPK